jgi:hypothetical protein
MCEVLKYSKKPSNGYILKIYLKKNKREEFFYILTLKKNFKGDTISSRKNLTIVNNIFSIYPLQF